MSSILESARQAVTDARAKGRNCQETVVDTLRAVGIRPKTARNLRELGHALGLAEISIDAVRGGVVKPSSFKGSHPSSLMTSNGLYIVGWVDSVHSAVIFRDNDAWYGGDQVGGFRQVAHSDAAFDAWFMSEMARWWCWAESERGYKPKARTPVFLAKRA